MAEQAERAFAQAFLNTLSAQPVAYADDYQQPPEHSLKRVPVLPIPVPPPPVRKPRLEPAASTSASISLTFKSIKPPFSVALSVHPTDTIASIKALLSSSSPSAPPADALRLLLKGKALADNKLLKEYSVKEGDTVNIVVKPGVNWDPTKTTTTTTTPAGTATDPSKEDNSTTTKKMDSTPSSNQPNTNAFKFGSGSLSPNPNPSTPPKPAGGHRRIPSVVLSPSPSEGTSPGVSGGPGSRAHTPEKDIILTLDPVTTGESEMMKTTYHETVADPMFWSRLYRFLEDEFKTAADVHTAFEDFLCATKGSLTPSEIAKIRDTVGVVGMAGT